MIDTGLHSVPEAGARPATPLRDFDEYRLLRPLATGTSGRVFLAEDTLLDRLVALKFVHAPDPRSVEEVFLEARAAARIQHPNVASVYRAGRIDDYVYLASEYVRGRALSEMARPIDWRYALEICCDLARGLAAAHRRGVLHCDLKPANALLGDDGVVRIVDFGLARLIASAEGAADVADRSLLGTPSFISPEAWRGEKLTVRSDLYSLGAIAYQLCSGRSAFDDVPPHLVGHAVTERDAPLLSSLAPGVEPRFAALVDRCLLREPQERFGSAEDLLHELEQLRPQTRGDVPEGNPYRGLQPFQPEHRSLFFGRRRDCLSVVERLRSDCFVLVTGDSGVGKSSLCLAGVFPSIHEGALGTTRAWRTAHLVPGRKPIAALAGALAPEDAVRAEDALRADPASFARELRRQLGDRRGILLFADQLEELVTLGAQESACFALALAELAAGYEGLRVLATVRSDFLGQLAELPSLGELVPRALYLLRSLGEEELSQAIVGPARLKGVRLESPVLVQELVSATVAAQGGLPLLQFTLAEMWEARDRERSVIPAAAIRAVGGVAGALARHADNVLAQLIPQQREAARRLLLRLATPQGTRASHTRDELVAGDAAAEGALEALVRGRLLVVRDGAAIELAHEALLTGWGTLARWLLEESDQHALRERVEAAAAEWERSGRAPDALWRARRLAEAARLDPQRLSPRGAQFVAASRLASRRAALRTRLIVAVGVVALAGPWTAIDLLQRRDRDRHVAERLSAARASLAEAQSSEARLAAAREESFREFDSGARANGEAGWQRALKLATEAEQAFAAAAERYEDALLLGGSRQDVRSAFADFLFARALHEQRPAVRDELVKRLRLYDRAGNRWRAFHASASLSVSVSPAGARVQIAPIVAGVAGKRAPGAARDLGSAPVDRLELEPGTYQLAVSAPDRLPVALPLQLASGEQRQLAIELPALAAVPAGFAFIPGGRGWFGTSADEAVRQFFNTTPIHLVETGPFLISTHETTYAEWIEYLRSLPAGERTQRSPHVGATGLSGQLDLREENGRWRLLLQVGSKVQVMTAGEKLRLPRSRRAEQDWLRLPVAGISFHDAQAYAHWLARTGRVPGARLCTEREWERAARGADDREFPNGDALEPDDADFDATYGKQAQAFGPDEVGSHPASRSPFGVDDLAGNVWEWVESSLAPGEAVARGGSAYAAPNTCRSVNREVPEPSFRAAVVGVRICAHWPDRARPLTRRE